MAVQNQNFNLEDPAMEEESSLNVVLPNMTTTNRQASKDPSKLLLLKHF
jgi:hypothetical protein